VPELRKQYLDHVQTIARDWLDWAKLGPLVAQYRALIEKPLEADTRKLMSIDAFRAATADQPSGEAGRAAPAGMRRGPGSTPLRTFADARRKYLLDYQPPSSEPRTKSASPAPAAPGEPRTK
jgi:hypothetical protein